LKTLAEKIGYRIYVVCMVVPLLMGSHCKELDFNLRYRNLEAGSGGGRSCTDMTTLGLSAAVYAAYDEIC